MALNPAAIAGQFTANAPIGSAPNTQTMLRGGAAAGYFDPMGSARLRDLRRRRAVELAQIQRQSAGTYGHLVGLDPGSQRQALIDANLNANAGMAGSLNAEEAAMGNDTQNFYRGLYGQEQDYQHQMALQREANKQASKGGWGQLAGGLVGSFLGPVGTAVGTSVGKHLAHGGVVYSPTKALIGEAGPEAVLPANSPGYQLLKSKGKLPKRRIGKKRKSVQVAAHKRSLPYRPHSGD
jgi:hypothetical protein